MWNYFLVIHTTIQVYRYGKWNEVRGQKLGFEEFSTKRQQGYL